MHSAIYNKSMEQLELYRKYRPQSLAEMVGNKIAIKALMTELRNGSHVFLLTGIGGCGKTTLSRIIATKVLKSTQIQEINSSDNRGIDTAREIIERMKFSSLDGSPSVWILDEMHAITPASMAAFLKPLEETPPNVYFFLCTTNPEKLVAPLKTRCSIVNLLPLNSEEMATLLNRIANSENITLTEEVRNRIIQIAEGSSRKALKLLAKVAAFTEDSDKLTALKTETSLEMSDASLQLCRLLYQSNSDWNTIADAIKNLNMPADNAPESVRQAILGYGCAILAKKPDPRILRILAAFSDDTYANGKFSIIMGAAEAYLEAR